MTGRLSDRGNSLVVRVNNQRRPEGVPTVNTDWWNYGGLTRDVLLLDVPAAFIATTSVQLKSGDPRPRRRATCSLRAPPPPRTSGSRSPELGVSAEAATDAGGRAAFDFALPGAALWTPEKPRRYKVSVSAADDRVAERIGFRTIETRGSDILLNGRPGLPARDLPP